MAESKVKNTEFSMSPELLQLDSIVLEQLKLILLKKTGLYYPPERSHELQRIVQMLIQDKHIDPQTFVQNLLNHDEQSWGTFINELTVRETYFYRDSYVFQVLESTVLPAIIDSKRSQKRLRFWSAGCCTGEEAYSLAIALFRVLADLQEWDIKIFATDINPQFLSLAREARYREWSFRGQLPWSRHMFFEKSGDTFVLRPEIKSLVQCEYFNIMELDTQIGVLGCQAFDLILCRNVFIYFDRKSIHKTLNKFLKIISPEGFFITGLSEGSSSSLKSFREHKVGDVVFYSKGRELTIHTPLDWHSTNLANENDIFNILNEDITSIDSTEPVEDYTLAVQSYHMKNYSDAERIAKKHLHGPHALEAQLLLANLYLDRREMVRARAYCNLVIHSDKLNAEAYYILALIQMDSGENAEHTLKKAIFIDSRFVMAYVLLGQTLAKHGKEKESSRTIKHALGLLYSENKEKIIPHSDGTNAHQLASMLETQLDLSNGKGSNERTRT